MKLLAISDHYIPHDYMVDGLASLEAEGVEIEVRRWEHEELSELQEANFQIEQHGPDAVELPDRLLNDLEGIDLLVIQFAPVPRQMIEAASDLKVIGVLRSGAENIDQDAADEKNICIMNTPGRNARAVAECTVGMILTEIRNLARAHAAMQQKKWVRDFPNSGFIPELKDKTVGLVGYGAVAELVAHFLTGFGCRILAHDPYASGDTSPAELVDLPLLMKKSDIVSLHARYTPETHEMIGAEQLNAMRPHAVLVNTARSGLIDDDALVAALREKKIAGAALDVFDEEPLSPDHPLLSLDNVTLTPHLAGSTSDAFRNSPKLMAGHLMRMLQGEKQLPIINGIEPSLP
jgi:D-3-phosphoglycerate dehydrogenase